MSAKDWRPVVSGSDWMRDQEKRVMSQERRPQVKHASDLLGPGFAPFAVQLRDWNAPEARFNGFWVGEAAANAPTPTGVYLGVTVGSIDGHAVQTAIRHLDTGTQVWVRQSHSHISQAPTYGPWELTNPPVPPGTMTQWPSVAAVPAGYLAADGTSKTTATYPLLAAALGATGTTFTVPAGPSGTGYRTIIKT